MKERQARFDGKLSNLEAIGAFISECMSNTGLSDEQRHNFGLSVDEHVSNLIEYAFENESDRMITITCRDEQSKSQVIIADRTAGFDPRNYTLPDFEGKTLDEISPGGFGNYFICTLMDDVEYIHQPYVENTLILTVYKKTMKKTEHDQ